MPRDGPPDATERPRLSTSPTFMNVRSVQHSEGLDAVVVGMPVEEVGRPGATEGPRAIRAASAMLHAYNPLLAVDLSERLILGDLGNVMASGTSDDGEESSDDDEAAAAALSDALEAGATPLSLGGAGTILLTELRALAARHGPVGLVRLDAHHGMAEKVDGRSLTVGTVLRRAAEDGLIDPARSLVAGLRGSLVDSTELGFPTELGIETVPYEELAASGPGGFAQRVHSRIGGRACALSLDVDFIDPAFAPGTAEPVVAGPSSREALTFVRSLAGLDFRAFDCVGVVPGLDPTGNTALVAATACFEMLSLAALRHS